MVILGIAGSLRTDSFNARLLAAAASELPAGVEYVRWDGLADLPIYDEDLDSSAAPSPTVALREAIARADAILIATPEYNGTIPGGLKNAVDWASRPAGVASLKGRPVAVIGASTGRFGGVWAQADLRKALGIAGARVVDGEFAVPRASDAFDSNGELDPSIDRTALRTILARLLKEARVNADVRGAAKGASPTTAAP